MFDKKAIAKEVYADFDDALEALDGYGGPLAAAIRKLALRVVPPENDKRGVCHSYIRTELLAIAGELENR
ncbi:MAG: hypothetical protein WBM08_05645 [Prochlorococcaceae cyanobacterium]